MSEQYPEQGGGGGFMATKWFGIPAPIVIVGLVVVAYFLYTRFAGGGSGAGSSSAGSSDTLTTGNTTVDTGAVQVAVNTGGGTDTTGSGNTTTTTNNGEGPPPKKSTTVTVPGVVGDTAQRARRVITRAGLNPSGITSGIVASESPDKGDKVQRGTTVTLKGKPKRRRVPPGR